MGKNGFKLVFGPDGRARTVIKNNNMSLVDGQMYTTVGNVTFGPNGTSYYKQGNMLLGSDGSSHWVTGNNPTFLL